MTSDVSSLPTQPPRADRGGGPRRLAAVTLLVGGTLTGIAPFIPWIQQTAATVGSTPASTSSRTASEDLIRIIHQTMLAPDSPATYGLAIDSSAAAFALWGVPLLLIALGLCILRTQRWVPKPRTHVFFRVLVLFGVTSTLLLVWLYLHIHRTSGVATTASSLGIGPAIALLGDLSALLGIFVLTRVTSTPRRPNMPKTSQIPSTPSTPSTLSTPSLANGREESDKPRLAPVPPGAAEPRGLRGLIPVEEW
jgi:hypothetical protein